MDTASFWQFFYHVKHKGQVFNLDKATILLCGEDFNPFPNGKF